MGAMEFTEWVKKLEQAWRKWEGDGPWLYPDLPLCEPDGTEMRFVEMHGPFLIVEAGDTTRDGRRFYGAFRSPDDPHYDPEEFYLSGREDLITKGQVQELISRVLQFEEALAKEPEEDPDLWGADTEACWAATRAAPSELQEAWERKQRQLVLFTGG